MAAITEKQEELIVRPLAFSSFSKQTKIFFSHSLYSAIKLPSASDTRSRTGSSKEWL